MDMKCVMRIAIAAVAFTAVAAPAFANPPGERARTDLPWGTTDSDPIGGGGGEGGPNMRITEQGHLDWPEFRAQVDASTAVAANHGPNGANATVQR
jgi:hypothetical protein